MTTSESGTDSELTPIEQVAFPFLEAAVCIDAAKQHPENRDALIAMLDRNVSLWMFLRSYVEMNHDVLSEDIRKFLVQISDFMMKSAIVLQDQPDDDLVQKIIEMNLNMSEIILKSGIPIPTP
ncbi:MAG: hypothetical protein GC191_11775 [Azospirillum sp.]|nr:hypothetical protein [Azospirillum sp.]